MVLGCPRFTHDASTLSPNTITVMSSIVNIIGGEDLYDHLTSIHFDNESIFRTSSKNYKESDNNLDIGLLTISCFVSYELKWVVGKSNYSRPWQFGHDFSFESFHAHFSLRRNWYVYEICKWTPNLILHPSQNGCPISWIFWSQNDCSVYLPN